MLTQLLFRILAGYGKGQDRIRAQFARKLFGDQRIVAAIGALGGRCGGRGDQHRAAGRAVVFLQGAFLLRGKGLRVAALVPVQAGLPGVFLHGLRQGAHILFFIACAAGFAHKLAIFPYKRGAALRALIGFNGHGFIPLPNSQISVSISYHLRAFFAIFLYIFAFFI